MLRIMGRRWWGPVLSQMLDNWASVLTLASTFVVREEWGHEEWRGMGSVLAL
jgi:hypothetical protein